MALFEIPPSHGEPKPHGGFDTKKGAADVNPKILRQHARDCDRMASECPDLFTKDALRELAVEFTRAADALESKSTKAPRRPSSSSKKSISSSHSRPTRNTAQPEQDQGGRSRRGSSAAR
jgi:hypothetical protein